jgi:hypothetical protein
MGMERVSEISETQISETQKTIVSATLPLQKSSLGMGWAVIGITSSPSIYVGYLDTGQIVAKGGQFSSPRYEAILASAPLLAGCRLLEL